LGVVREASNLTSGCNISASNLRPVYFAGGEEQKTLPASLFPPPSYEITEPEGSFAFIADELRDKLYHTYRNSPDREETLNEGTSYYCQWRDALLYLIFKEYTPEGSTRFKAVKASKRGNDVYRWRIRKRFEGLDALLSGLILDSSVHTVSRANALFITLTYARNLSIGAAWARVSSDYAKFAAYLRKTYGCVALIKTIAAQSDGFPHVHIAAFFEEKLWCVKRLRGTFRLETYRDKQRFTQAWGHGNVDVEAITDPKKASHYILGHVTGETKKKSNIAGEIKKNVLDDRSLFLCWLFRKKSFSISNRDLIVTCITQTNKHQILQMNLNMCPIPPLPRRFCDFELVGMVNITFFTKPPPFSIDLELHGGIKRDILSVIAGIVEKENKEKGMMA